MLATLLVCVTANAQTQSPFALERAGYDTFSADINGDGQSDLLVRARRIIVPVMLDDLAVPIVVKPPSPTFVLLSGSGNTYTLDAAPAQSLVSDSRWQASAYELAYGDVTGSNFGSMMIRSLTANSVTFIITTNSTSGAPELVQTIDGNDLGLDLGATGTTTELRRVDGDARSDLVVRLNGLIQVVFIADASGRFAPAADPTGGATAAWNGFRLALDLGDRASALNMLSVGAVPEYTDPLTNLGTNINGISQYWSSVQLVDADSSFVTLFLSQTYAGLTRGHLVTMINEGGRWVVDEF